MNCLDFKKLALSDPGSAEPSFVLHSKQCPDCLKYVGGVRQMDSDLSNSVEVKMPESLMARLELNQMLEEEAKSTSNVKITSFKKYAMAASFAAVLFISGFMVSNFYGSHSTLDEDYEALLSGVLEHINSEPMTPVWDPQRANESVNTHLANYDGKMKLKFLANLQFARLCPMGKYRGLHASLDTGSGQVTFVYIKGANVDDLLDASYAGYVTRIKPIRGGNLVIVSRNNTALVAADKQLEQAIYWEI